MTEIIKNYIDQIQIGAEQSYKNLTIFPVLSDYVIPFDYLTLDEALSKNLIEVVEIDEGGSVPELKVINKSEIMVLILDGEELVGAEDTATGVDEEEPVETGLENSEVITSTSRTNEAAVILPTPSPTRPPLPATLDQINLKVEVTERSWFEATIDDEVVFSGIARPGDTFEWTAANEAKLLTGNAIGLFVTLNEIPLGRLGDRGQNKEGSHRQADKRPNKQDRYRSRGIEGCLGNK